MTSPEILSPAEQNEERPHPIQLGVEENEMLVHKSELSSDLMKGTVRPKLKIKSGLQEGGAHGKGKGEWEQSSVFTALLVRERSLETPFVCRTCSIANKQEGSWFQFPCSAVICSLQPASGLHVGLVFKSKA